MAQINETPPDLPVTVSEPVRNLVYSCIAKNPADRPQSAAHLARAATALRRGDVQAAAAAVPAVLGAAGVTAATMLMPNQGATAATTVLPSAAAGGVGSETVEEEPEERKRSPWTWPLIVLIAILAIVLIGTIIALALNRGGGEDPASTTARPTSTSAPPTTQAPPPTSEAPETIQIDRNSYIGMNIDDAAAAIEALGLPVTRQEGSAATEPGLANTVSEVNPSGPVQPGTTITLTYLTDPEQPATPSSGPTVNGAVDGDVKAGANVQVSWEAQQCPAGQTLSGYTVTVSGGAIQGSGDPSSTSVGPGQTSVSVTVADTPGQNMTARFLYFCGQLSSPDSPTSTFTITEP
jgi:serine/threonine-protein kinase